MITENVFESRFMFAQELARLGADLRTDGHHAVVRGRARALRRPGGGATTSAPVPRWCWPAWPPRARPRSPSRTTSTAATPGSPRCCAGSAPTSPGSADEALTARLRHISVDPARQRFSAQTRHSGWKASGEATRTEGSDGPGQGRIRCSCSRDRLTGGAPSRCGPPVYDHLERRTTTWWSTSAEVESDRQDRPADARRGHALRGARRPAPRRYAACYTRTCAGSLRHSRISNLARARGRCRLEPTRCDVLAREVLHTPMTHG